MKSEQIRAYLWSLPERAVRSLTALAAGVVREAGEVVLPARIRRSRLYYSLVESTLRFLIEQVGQVEGAYEPEGELPRDFLIRRAAGNVIEAAGIVAFRASPVWVLAALADLSGAGRELIHEIADALKKEGLLEADRSFDTMDQLLDGLERTAGRLAETANTPPLDVPSLRREWADLRAAVRGPVRAEVPKAVEVRAEWEAVRQEAAAQKRSVFELSSAMAISAVRKLPENARWLSRVARTSARRTGEVLAQGLLDHYRTTRAEIREIGYARYCNRELGPYFRGALQQFSPKRVSTTERLLSRRRGRA